MNVQAPPPGVLPQPPTSLSAAMNVTIEDATRADAPALQNLLQLYTHDFSEHWAGTPKGDLMPDGRFADYPLDDYWSRPRWSALLVRCDDHLAGFALVNDRAHSGKPVDRNMAELFIVRKYRGRGVGRAAVERIFARHPGQWEVAVARKNVAALSFWRTAIRGASQVCELDMNSAEWNGPILRFEWSAARIG
jgi:predicted acetyltransferase